MWRYGDRTDTVACCGNQAQHFYIWGTYLIPKVWVIEYVPSDYYYEHKERLKVRI